VRVGRAEVDHLAACIYAEEFESGGGVVGETGDEDRYSPENFDRAESADAAGD
jgi:hypothetical protein